MASSPRPLPPVCLSINACDCTGVLLASADQKTFTALGTFGVAVTTCVIAQSWQYQADRHAIPDSVLRDQLEAVEESLPVMAVKVGLCPTASSIRVVARWLRQRQSIPVIIDPVISTNLGIPEQGPEVLAALQEELLPLATLATPNRFEAATLTKMDETLTSEDMERAAKLLFQRCGCPVIVTGGGSGDQSIDVFFGLDGASHFVAPSIKRDDRVIGVGCTYSAAITAQLARGEGMRESILAAKSYIAAMIESAPLAASGQPTPVCHTYAVDNLAQGEGIGVSTGSYRAKD